jgi:hypothetical protein
MFDQLAYTIPQAVQVAAVSRTELYRAAQRAEIVFHKRGRRTIVLADELRRWVQSLPTAKQSKAA